MGKSHTWIVERVDGGPMGSDDFYKCSVCGCSGGEILQSKIQKDSNGKATFTSVDRRPSPFIPGFAEDLDDDCDVAKVQIRATVRGFLSAWWREPFHNHLHYFADDTVESLRKERRTILEHAEKYTPTEKSRMGIADFLIEAHDPLCRISIETLKNDLLTQGYLLESPSCTRCGKPTDRPGDDQIPICYSCYWKEHTGEWL